MNATSGSPYVVAGWVSGTCFYGRHAEISEILEGPRNAIWVPGTWRIGKTSLLRQLEQLTLAPSGGYLPLFWDLQPAGTLAALRDSFRESLVTAAERLGEVGLTSSDVEAPELFASLGLLRRLLRERQRRLLLLCDGAEALLPLQQEHPSLLRKLRRELQAEDAARWVLASAPALWRLAAQREDTSPLLLLLTPPLYLGVLKDDEARALIRQTQAPRASRSGIEADAVEEIRKLGGNHPFLIQLLCQRFLAAGTVDEAFETIAAAQELEQSFTAAVQQLSEGERAILRAVAEGPGASAEDLAETGIVDSGSLRDGVLRLANLGLLGRAADGRLVPSNDLFRRWIAGLPAETPSVAERVTRIVSKLSQVGTGEASPQELFPLVYDDLRRLAQRFMGRERPGHTLQATAVVHEAYLKLVDQSRADWKGRSHFFAVAAQAMRRILIDHARSRKRAKRGADPLRVTLAEELVPSGGRDVGWEDLLALNRAVERLARLDRRQARVVELRFFAGMTADEVANVLGVSRRTVEGDWARARDWLKKEME